VPQLLAQARGENFLRQCRRRWGCQDVRARQSDIHQLLADYKKTEDIVGENGLLKQLTKAVAGPFRVLCERAGLYSVRRMNSLTRDRNINCSDSFDILVRDTIRTRLVWLGKISSTGTKWS